MIWRSLLIDDTTFYIHESDHSTTTYCSTLWCISNPPLLAPNLTQLNAENQEPTLMATNIPIQ